MQGLELLKSKQMVATMLQLSAEGVASSEVINMIDFDDSEYYAIALKYLDDPLEHEDEMAEATKLFYFQIARHWPDMTVERLQLGADIMQ